MIKRIAHTGLLITLFWLNTGCTNDENIKANEIAVNDIQDIPEPRSKMDQDKSNEVLAPQTCYYGCKASK